MLASNDNSEMQKQNLEGVVLVVSRPRQGARQAGDARGRDATFSELLSSEKTVERGAATMDRVTEWRAKPIFNILPYGPRMAS